MSWAREWYETQVKECDKTSGGKYLAYMLEKLSVELNMQADGENTVLDMIRRYGATIPLN